MKCFLCDEDFESEDLDENGLCEDCQHDREEADEEFPWTLDEEED